MSYHYGRRPIEPTNWGIIEYGRGSISFDAWKVVITAHLSSDIARGHAYGLKRCIPEAWAPMYKPKGYDQDEARKLCVDLINQGIEQLVTNTQYTVALWDIEVMDGREPHRRQKDFVQKIRPELITGLVGLLSRSEIRGPDGPLDRYNPTTISLSDDGKLQFLIKFAKMMEGRGPLFQAAFLSGFESLPEDLQERAKAVAAANAAKAQQELPKQQEIAADQKETASRCQDKSIAKIFRDLAQRTRTTSVEACTPIFDRFGAARQTLALTQ
ncbi:MAG: hypothetical protein WAO98_09855 [Alphaproteobacteria bacterium]